MNPTSQSTPSLLQWQSKPVQELVEGFSLPRDEKGILLVGDGGVGKSYIICETIARLWESGTFFSEEDLNKPFQVFIVTPASVVMQFERVWNEFKPRLGPLEAYITNYAQFSRAKLGKLFVEDYTVVEHGQAEIKFKWKEKHAPRLFVWDEVQALRYRDSVQTKIGIGATKLARAKHLPMSATPFSRISEAFAVGLMLSPMVNFGCIRQRLEEKEWPEFACTMCARGKKDDDHSPKNLENLGKYLKEQGLLVSVDNVKFKHKATTIIRGIDFQTAEELEEYNKAEDLWLEELAKCNREEPGGIARIWVANLKFFMAAERIRAPHVARGADLSVKSGKQAFIASNFLGTLRAVYSNLIELGYTKDEISYTTGQHINGESEGIVSRKVRQEMLDKFQRGDSKIHLISLKAGGAGLSAHHEGDKYPRSKPREVIIPFAWSEILLYQVLKRCCRATSTSDTSQVILKYNDTIEDKVMDRVMYKLKAMKGLGTASVSIVDELMKAALKCNDEDYNPLLGIEDLKELQSEDLTVDEDGIDSESGQLLIGSGGDSEGKSMNFELVID